MADDDVVLRDHVAHETEEIAGVSVERSYPLGSQMAADILFVHGGNEAGWAFSKFRPFFAEKGWRSHALNWFGRNHSKDIDEAGALQRGIGDVATEISLVANTLPGAPILVCHSMGSVAGLKYAEHHEVAALVLLAPIPTKEAGIPDFPVPFDENSMWGPPPFDVARQMFLDGLDDEEAAYYYSKLCPESPKCVMEAVQANSRVSIDPAKIACPVLVIGGSDDLIVPIDVARRVSIVYGAEFHAATNRGHNLPLERNWIETATVISDWLAKSLGAKVQEG